MYMYMYMTLSLNSLIVIYKYNIHKKHIILYNLLYYLIIFLIKTFLFLFHKERMLNQFNYEDSKEDDEENCLLL